MKNSMKKLENQKSDGQALVLDSANIDALFAGCRILGCGGGGDTQTGELLASEALKNTQISVLTPTQAKGIGLLCLPIGIVGASGGVLNERLPRGAEFDQVVRTVEQISGKKIGALVPIEAGGLNGAISVWAAARLGLPIIDGDLSGRAVPRLDQLTAGYSGRPLTPAVCIDPDGRQLVLGADGREFDAPRVEAVIRSVLASGSGWLAAGFRPLHPAEVNAHVVAEAISRCFTTGLGYVSAPCGMKATAVSLSIPGGAVHCSGRVIDVCQPSFYGSVEPGWVLIESAGSVVRVDLQSEFLAVSVDGRQAAATPDVIALIENQRDQILKITEVEVGQTVRILSLPALVTQLESEYSQKVGMSGFGMPAGAI